MNREAIQATIDLMKQGMEVKGKPLGFDMCYFFDSCGTAACVAGWALLASGLDYTKVSDNGSSAQELFGITTDEATQLFYTYGHIHNLDDAILTLENLLHTGKVKWPQPQEDT